MFRLPKPMVQSIHGNNGSLAYFVEYEDDDDDDDAKDGEDEGDEGSVPSDLCMYNTNFLAHPIQFLAFCSFSCSPPLLSLPFFPLPFKKTHSASTDPPCPLVIVIQTPYSPFQDFSLAARINLSTGHSNILFFSTTESDLNILIRRLCLRHHTQTTHHSPLALFATLFETYGYTSEECRRRLDTQIVALEVRTGMTSTYLDTSFSNGGGWAVGGGAGGYALQISDYEKLMRDLHSANTNLIFLLNVLNFEAELGDFCRRIFDEFEDLRARINHRHHHLKKKRFHSARAKDEFRQHLAYCVDSSRFRLKQTQSLRMRVESQINVVSPFFYFSFSSSFFPVLLFSYREINRLWGRKLESYSNP